MSTIKKVGRVLMLAGMIMVLAVPAMASGKQTRSNGGQGSGDRIRTPGSCKLIETNADFQAARLIAARNGSGTGTQDRTRTRTRTPGSCKSAEQGTDAPTV